MNSIENIECDLIGKMLTKNDLKQNKDILKISGIYKILNKINGKYYLGSSKDIKSRWKIHRSNLNNNNHPNDYLQSAWNKYGESNFEFIIIETLNNDKNLLLNKEQKYLDILKSDKQNDLDTHYNLRYDARRLLLTTYSRKKMSEKLKILNCGKNNPNYGKKHTTESKQKISLANIGKVISDSHKLLISSKLKGIKKSSEHCKKISIGRTGIKRKPFSVKHKQKMSDNSRGPKNPAFNHTIYNFYNKISKESFIGTSYEFYTKYKYNRGGVGNFINGKRNHYKNWILLSN